MSLVPSLVYLSDTGMTDSFSIYAFTKFSTAPDACFSLFDETLEKHFGKDEIVRRRCGVNQRPSKSRLQMTFRCIGTHNPSNPNGDCKCRYTVKCIENMKVFDYLRKRVGVYENL